MHKRLLFGLAILFSFSATAGKVTIEKSDSLIRNDLFQQKQIRAEQYKLRENERKKHNEIWLESLEGGCGLLTNAYLLYSCADGRYFQGEQQGDKLRYRPLSKQQVNKLFDKSE